MSMHRLRYTGEAAVSFQTGGVGLVAPGGEFDVDETLTDRFTRRPDIEQAAPRRQRPRPATTRAAAIQGTSAGEPSPGDGDAQVPPAG